MTTPTKAPKEGSHPQARGRRLKLAHLEVLLLALALFATVAISYFTLAQTTHHFRVQRTSDFVSRFNSLEMVALREEVDRWLEGSESPKALYARSVPTSPDRSAALNLVSKLRTLANFFQEFGTALKHGNLDEQYVFDLLGAVCVRYGLALEPFILETRQLRRRARAYEDVFWLRNAMIQLDSSLADTPVPGK